MVRDLGVQIWDWSQGWLIDGLNQVAYSEKLGVLILLPSQVEAKSALIVVLFALGLQIDASRASWGESIDAALFLRNSYILFQGIGSSFARFT